MVQFRLLAAAALASLLSLTSSPAQAGDGQRALGLMPRNTTLAVTWNVARSRLSAVGVELVDLLADSRVISGTVQRLRRRMKLDWQRDIDTVVVGMGADFVRTGNLMMLIEGKVNRQKLLAAAQKERGFRALVHRGIDYYQVGRAEIAFIDQFWVTTRAGSMPRIINVFRGQAPSVRRNKRMMGLLGSVDLGKDMWCVFGVPKGLRDQIASGQEVRAISASVDLRKRVRARVRLGLTDRASVIAVGMWLRAQGPTDAEIAAMGLSDAVRAASISRRGNNLDLILTIAAADLAKLERYLRENAKGNPEAESG